jgi:heptosyltransferase II
VKILVVTLSNLGDVVLTLPVIQALRERHPDARLDVVTGASGKAVFEGDTRLNRVTVYDRRVPWSEKIRFLGSIRRERYDILVDLRYSMLGLFGGARKRNSYLTAFSRRGHRAARHLRALEGLASPAAESFLSGLPGRSAFSLPEGRIVAAAVGSKSDLKKWPAEKYAALLDRLAGEQGCSIVLVGDTHDRKDAETVKRAMHGPVLDLTGKTDFKQLVGVLRRAALVITNDSAPLHIADSLKVPVLAIFGPTDPKKYGPRRVGSEVAAKRLFCQPCERAQSRFGHECMKELDAAEVYPQAVRVLNDAPRAGGYRILVIRLDRIGDLALSLPALEELRRRFPGASISVMTRPATADLLLGHPSIDEVIPYRYEKGGRHAFPRGYLRFLEEIMKRRFDAAVILHPGIRSYLVPFLAGIPRRIGYRGRHAWLLTQALPDERHLGKKHESQYAVDLAAALGGEAKAPAAPPRLAIDPQSVSDVSGELQRSGVGTAERLLALHPGASCVSKRWPKEKFAELARRLSAGFPEHRLVIVGGKETAEAAAFIAAAAPVRAIDVSGKLGLRELSALLSRCDLLVSNDSGPVHVAAAVGTRVISLFGRNQAGLSETRWRPLGEGHAVLRKDVGCQVCLAHRCTIGFECLEAIQPEEVLEMARRLLAQPAAVR